LDRTVRLTVAGLAYGVVLFLFAFVCVGAGHGSYLPFAIFGAPLSLIHPVAGLFAAPVLWALFGFLMGRTERRMAPAALLLLHLVGVLAVLSFGNSFESKEEQWEYFRKAVRFVPGALWGGFGVYPVGQVVTWTLVVRLRYLRQS
jgi:hypothetical protein